MTIQTNRRQFLAGTGVALGSTSAFKLVSGFCWWPSGRTAVKNCWSVCYCSRAYLNDFKEKSGVGSVSGKGDIFPNTQTELLSGSKAYDCWETIGERLPAMTVTNTIKPIPTSKLSNWNSIRDTFTKTDPRMEARAQISGQIWSDASQSSLWMVPTVYNFDSIGYRPDLVEAEEANTWTSLFDKKFKGKTGLNVDPLIAIGQAILAMNSLGMLDVPNPGNPNKSEIDEAAKFLISKKKEGQFRALWGDFGELVGLLASGEMVLADAWQPAVMAVKAQGIECAYAEPKEGLGDGQLVFPWLMELQMKMLLWLMPITGYQARQLLLCLNRVTIHLQQQSRITCPKRSMTSGMRASLG
jgi:spermidine/putrescine-binding protein